MKGGTRKRGKTCSYYFDMGAVNGKRQKKEKGGFPTKKEAEAALAAALNQYNAAGTIFTPSEITVADFLDLWFDQYVKMYCKYNTQLNYVKIIEYHLKPQFGSYHLKALTAAPIQEYANDLKKQGFAKSTLKNIILTFSAALNYAVEPLNYIQFNPVDRVKFPKYEYGEGRQGIHHFIPQDDMKRVLERFPESSPFYVPIMIGYYTGVRISECFGLTWDRIDLKNQTITIDRQIIKQNFGDVRDSLDKGREKMDKSEWYFQSPKTETSKRVIRYGKTLQGVLQAAYKSKQKNRIELGSHFTEYYLKPEKDEKGDTIFRLFGVPRDVAVSLEKADLVCVRPDGSAISTDSFKYVCRVCRTELHMEFNYHSLRHTHATMLLEAGAPIKDVQNRLGHADVQTTINRYVHDTDNMKNETVEIFDRITNLA
jgi:integrase